MGITANDFFENIYSVIFSPKAFFEKESINTSIRLSIGTIIFISIINKLAIGIFDKSILYWTFIPGFIWYIVSVVILWFLTALFFEYIAKIFDRSGNINKLLFLTAFAPIPYIFFAPLNLLKSSGEFGYVVASIAELFLYIWIIYLYVLALKSTYKISIARAYMMIFIPFISIFFAIYWTVCFCQKMWYIFSM